MYKVWYIIFCYCFYIRVCAQLLRLSVSTNGSETANIKIIFGVTI